MNLTKFSRILIALGLCMIFTTECLFAMPPAPVRTMPKAAPIRMVNTPHHPPGMRHSHSSGEVQHVDWDQTNGPALTAFSVACCPVYSTLRFVSAVIGAVTCGCCCQLSTEDLKAEWEELAFCVSCTPLRNYVKKRKRTGESDLTQPLLETSPIVTQPRVAPAKTDDPFDIASH